MTNTPNENSIQEPNQDQSIQCNQFNQFNEEKRSNQSFHMSPKIAEAFRIFAHKIPKKSVGRVAEMAFNDYMEQNPLETFIAPIQQKMGESLTTVQDRLEQKILCKDISHLIKILDRMNGKTGGDREEFQAELISHVKKAIKIKNPNEELVQLMEKVDGDGYLE